MRTGLSGLLIMFSILGASAVASKPATYEGVDLTVLEELSSKSEQPDMLVIAAFEEMIDAGERRRRNSLLLKELRYLKEEWQVASRRLDRELLAVVEQAEADSVYRAWAGFFGFVAATANIAASLANSIAEHKPKESAGKVSNDVEGRTSRQLPADLGPREGEVMEVETVGREVFEEGNGEWRRIYGEELIRRHVYRPGDGGNVESGMDPGSAKLVDKVLNGMGTFVTGRLQSFEGAGGELYCADGWQGCIVNNSTGEIAKPLNEVSSIRPTGVQQQVFRAVKKHERQFGRLGISIAADFTPVVGDIKGIVEGVAGRDAFTGEEIGSVWRVLGMVPLVGGRVRGAKSLAKIIKEGRGMARVSIREVGELTKKQALTFSRISRAAKAGLREVDDVPSGLGKSDLRKSGLKWLCGGAKPCEPYFGKTRSKKGEGWLLEVPGSRFTNVRGETFANYRRVRMEDTADGGAKLNAELVNLNVNKRGTWMGKGSGSKNVHVEIRKR